MIDFEKLNKTLNFITMKTFVKLFKLSLTAIFIAIPSMNAVASEYMNITSMNNSKSIQVEIDAPQLVPVIVYLQSEDDKIIYMENIVAGSTFDQQIDFNDYNNGTYILTSQKGNMRYNSIIEVNDSYAEITSEYYSFIPEFRMNEDRIIVHYINNVSDKVNVKIKDRWGLVYNEYFYDDAIFSRAFTTEGLVEGDYTLEFTSEGETFTFTFDVE